MIFFCKKCGVKVWVIPASGAKFPEKEDNRYCLNCKIELSKQEQVEKLNTGN